MKNELINRIQSGNATIGVVGLGYVGLPLALRFAETGFKVIGFDVDAAKAETIADRQSYFSHIAHERVGQAVDNGFAVTSDMAECAQVDVCKEYELSNIAMGYHRPMADKELVSDSLMQWLRVI